MKRRRRQTTTLDYFRHNVKWFMIFIAVIFIAGIFLMPGYGGAGGFQCNGQPPHMREFEDETLAQIGDKEFKASQIGFQAEQQIRRMREFNPNTLLPPETNLQTRWYVLDEMLKNAVLLEKAKQDKEISIPASEVDEQYNQQKIAIMRQLELIDPELDTEASIAQLAHRGIQAQKAEKAFQSFLSQRGLSPQAIRDEIKNNMLIQKFNEKLNDEAREEVDAEAKQRAMDIFALLEPDGSDMEEITNMEEHNYASFRRITDQTRKNAKSTSEELSTILFTSELNKVLEPVKINNNWTIIYIEERIIAEGEEFEAAKDDIIAEIKEELGIYDDELDFGDIDEISEEEFQRMITEAGLQDEDLDDEAIDELVDESDLITDDMIKERYEKVTYSQIQVRPESIHSRTQEKIEAMKKEVGIEIHDPMLRAYSYIADFDPEKKDFERAIEEFKNLREDLKVKVVEAEAEFLEIDERAEAAPEDDPYKYQLLTEASIAEQSYLAANDNLARINYLISDTMQDKIQHIYTKLEQEYFDKRREDPESYDDITMPEPSKEQQAEIDRMKDEMYDLMTEAVELSTMTEPYYYAMLGELQIEREEWLAAYESWQEVIEYANVDVELLRQADMAFNRFLDELEEIDIEKREEASSVYDRLQESLMEAERLEQEQRQKQQEMMQRMLEEQMAAMGEDF